MISHPSPTNQNGIDTQIQRTFLFYSVLGSKSIQYELKIRRRVGSLFIQIDGKGYGNGGEAHTAISTTVNSNTTGDDNHVKWLGETATYGDTNVDISDNTVALSFEELENAKAVK